MKKTISVISLFAILLCLLLSSCEPDEYEPIVYVSSVEVTNTPDKFATNPDTQDNIKVYFVHPDENTGKRTFQIEWRVVPETATDNNVKFIYTSDPRFSVSETGLVEFYEGGVVANIQIVPNDGSDCLDVIKIYCLD